jgi:hypothetical protein
MNYCKFQQTLSALRQCAFEWDEENGEDETRAKEMLIKLMIELLRDEEEYTVTLKDE